jgi:hypothetical protein
LVSLKAIIFSRFPEIRHHNLQILIPNELILNHLCSISPTALKQHTAVPSRLCVLEVSKVVKTIRLSIPEILVALRLQVGILLLLYFMDTSWILHEPFIDKGILQVGPFDHLSSILRSSFVHPSSFMANKYGNKGLKQ